VVVGSKGDFFALLLRGPHAWISNPGEHHDVPTGSGDQVGSVCPDRARPGGASADAEALEQRRRSTA